MASTTRALDSELSSSEQNRVPLDGAFKLFPKLPIKLRLIIWEMVLPGPRCIEVALIEESPRDHFRSNRQRPLKYLCVFNLTEKSHAILFTCQESRQAAFKHYQPFEHRGYSTEKTCFIDPIRDILFYNGCLLALKSLEDVFKLIPNVTRLALDAFSFRAMLRTKPDFRRLGKLKELIALPSVPYCEGAVFKDLYQPIWDSTITRRSRGPSYLSILEVEKTLRSLEGREGGSLDYEAWVAPKLRIGRLIRGSGIVQG